MSRAFPHWLRSEAIVHYLACSWTLVAAFCAIDPPRSHLASDDPAASPRVDSDALRPLPETIFVVGKEIGDAVRFVPDGFFLSKEKYQALMDRIELLERQARQALPPAPTACRLSGQFDGDIARIQIQFDLVTHRPQAIVSLGCQRAWLRPGSSLDEKLPNLTVSDDGTLKVQVETPGVHLLKLELDVPIVARGLRGQERCVDFGLPGSAITTIERFAFPSTVHEIRLNDRTTRTVDGEPGSNRVEGVSLGPPNRLELSWRTSGTPMGEPIALEVDGRITVRMRESSVVTDVELTLRPFGGEARLWQVIVPADAVCEIRNTSAQDHRIASIELPQPTSPMLTVRLKEPSCEPFKLTFQLRQPRLGSSFDVGPIRVPGALRERGVLAISTLTDKRVRYQPRGDVVARALSDENRREHAATAEFTYGNLATTSSEPDRSAALLKIELDEQRGAVETRVEHQLAMVGTGWRDKFTLYVTPVRTRINQLEIELPPGFRYDASVGPEPLELIERVEIRETGLGTLIARLKFVRDVNHRFTATLVGTYDGSAAQQQAQLELPRPLQTLDRGGEILVSTSDVVELVPSASGPDAAASGRLATVHSKTSANWQTQRVPRHMILAWKPIRTELSVISVADVTLTQRAVRVKQRLILDSGETALHLLKLSVPSAIRERLHIIEGGKLHLDDTVEFVTRPDGKCLVILEYSQPLSVGAAEIDSLAVAFVGIPAATQADVKVRLWNETTSVAELNGGPWRDQPLEIVSDRSSCPFLVARCDALTHPLNLFLRKAVRIPSPLIVERSAIRVSLAEDGSQSCSAHFLVQRLSSTVEIELRAAASRVPPLFLVDGKALDPATVEQVSDKAGTTQFRLSIPEPHRHKPGRIEVRYPCAPESSGWSNTFHSPQLNGCIMASPTFWRISLPPARLVVWNRGFDPVNRWEFAGGFLTPRPRMPTSETKRWLGINEYDSDDVSAAGWRDGMASIELIHVHRPSWLMFCSVMFTGFILVLLFGPMSSRYRWIIIGGVCLLGIVVADVQPHLAWAILYGCEPGLIVFLPMLGLWWLFQRRRSKARELQSAFRRTPMNSGAHHGNRTWEPAQPSTVDTAGRGSQLNQIAKSPS